MLENISEEATSPMNHRTVKISFISNEGEV